MSELPKGWASDKLGNLVVVERGSSPRPIKSFLTDSEDGVNWIKIGDAKKGQKLIISTAEKITKEGALKSRFVDVGDFILSNSMSFGLPYIMGIPGYIHDGWFVFRLPKQIDSNFFYYLLSSSYVGQQFNNLAVGGVVKNISGDLVKKADLPLPPLAEQKRIVEKLDEVLAQVDTIKARLDGIPDLLKRFRQSVLASAVSGKLTEEWRGGSSTNWEPTVFDDLVLTSGNGLSKRKGDEGSDVTVLRLADFKNAQRVYGNERQIVLTDKECGKYILSSGDLLAIRVNGSIDLAGKFICYTEKNKMEAFCDHFIRFSLDLDKIIPDFMIYIANEGEGRHYLQSSLSTSAGQNTINQKSIKALKLSLPSLSEQKEIVRLVDEFFTFADSIEAQVKKAQARVDNLTQSILAKAFRGELVAQDPNDEPADKLLERISEARKEAEALAKAAKKAEAAKKRAAKSA